MNKRGATKRGSNIGMEHTEVPWHDCCGGEQEHPSRHETSAAHAGRWLRALMNWFKKHRLLRYPSVEAWMDGEGIKSLLIPDDPARQHLILEQYGEFRQKLWNTHLKTLTSEERGQIARGEHPSQSHARAEAARIILNEFKQRYGTVSYIGSIDMGWFHMDRIVFSVLFNRDVPWRQWQKDLPLFFKGFEIKAGTPD